MSDGRALRPPDVPSAVARPHPSNVAPTRLASSMSKRVFVAHVDRQRQQGGAHRGKILRCNHVGAFDASYAGGHVGGDEAGTERNGADAMLPTEPSHRSGSPPTEPSH